jgi:tetratricopeptide (TPR) repeat protein/TolB-like protein
MADPANSAPSTGFFAELRRRRVLHIGGIYVAGAWLITEIASFLLEQAGAPVWAFRLLAIVFVVGFPVAVVLAWLIQVQPDGKWAVDSSKGHHRTVMAAIALGVAATAGLSWLILPRIEGTATAPSYQPIPNSVAILPLAVTVGTPNERSIAETLLVSLGRGLDQSADLILMDLRKLSEQPENPTEFGRSIKAAALLTGEILQAPGATRIRMDLLDVGQGEVTWSRTFDWDASRIGDTGTAIANDVLGTMTLPALSRDVFTGTDNPDAYHAFLLGGQHAASLNITDLATATAMDEYQRAIDLDPEYVLAYVALAETIEYYRELKSPDQAELQALEDRARQALETALALDPESAAAISHLGWLSRRSGDRELAIEAYQHALELDPNHAKSYWRLGWGMLRYGWAGINTGNLEEAERLLRKALELDPLNARWRRTLARFLFDELGRDEEAYAELYRSIELEPRLWTNYLLLGFWEAYEYGRLDEALILLRKAYALDPENKDAANWVASMYGDFGARKEALAWMKRALETGPGSSGNWYIAYQIYYLQGFEDEAMGYAVRALELDPGNAWALHAVGIWDIRQGRVEEALERWRLAFPLYTASDRPAIDASDLRPLLYYASNLMEAGETTRASSLLEQCLDVLDKWQKERFVRESVVLDLEQEIYAALRFKEETLAAMRTAIIDRQNYSGTWMYAYPMFDFIRQEPEFHELMAIMQANLARQYERVRELERNGELPPAPGVEIDP